MENKKQSSIEWFAMMLAEQGLLITKDYENLITYKEAKAMHQKEIEEAYDAVIIDENGGLLDGKEYYKETFGGQDNE